MRPAFATNRARLAGTAVAALLIGGAAAAQWLVRDPLAGVPRQPAKPIEEQAPLCPWREPEQDLRAFFPGATVHRTEIRILSGEHVTLQARLGRPPSPDEHAIYLHRVEQDGRTVGTLVVRRLRGEYGAIEVVVAAGPDLAVRGIRLQRLREPDAISRALTAPGWLRRFKGMTSESDWTSPALAAGLPAEAETSGKAVVEGMRSLLILLDAAEKRGLPSEDVRNAAHPRHS